MVSVLAALSLGLPAVTSQATAESKPEQKPKYEMATYQFVRLVAGPNSAAYAAGEAAKLQKEHLERLQGLWDAGKIVAVGPIVGSEPLRGIVILDVKTKEEAVSVMAEDPFVKAGRLEALVTPWMAAKGIARKGPKFLDLEPMWLGFFKRPPNAPTYSPEKSQEIQKGHLANNEKMAAAGALLWAGPFLEDTPLRGVLVFRNVPKEKVLEMVAQDPAVKAGRLELELHAWLTPKGSWPPPTPAP